jgi:hypothetical protein
MATTVIQSSFEDKVIDHRFFGNKVGLLTRLFGCGHQELSRPFSRGKSGYRSCLRCGARKPFNPETLETSGKFYYPPLIDAE